LDVLIARPQTGGGAKYPSGCMRSRAAADRTVVSASRGRTDSAAAAQTVQTALRG